jgi:hypothetical protein
MIDNFMHFSVSSLALQRVIGGTEATGYRITPAMMCILCAWHV